MVDPAITRSAAGAILYDYLLVAGGAEKLTLTLARALHREADLWVGFVHRDFPSHSLDYPRPIVELCRDAPLVPWRILRTLRAFRTRTRHLRHYDWVLYSGFYAPTAVHHHTQGANLYYCHTVPRYAYDLKDYYLDSLPRWQRPLLQRLIHQVRRSYEPAMAAMDRIIVNSENVRRRVGRYLGRDAQVIHPPCDTHRFHWLGQQDYYLSTARLEPLKRVEILVDAFRAMPDKTLVVTSGGSELARLRARAAGADNIHFTGWLSDSRLRELTGNALATLYIPRDEDFGISPVESMAAGKPVIGVAEGGLLETVVHGHTGVLLDPDPTPRQVIQAVRDLGPDTALSLRAACEARARRFGRERFLTQMRQVIRQSVA